MRPIMANNIETRYGTTHGSGRVFTEIVFKLLKNGAAQNRNPKAAQKLALAVAWANGCLNPQGNIDRNGAWENAVGDARNSFLFGHMLDVVGNSGNQDLFNQLKNGQETLGRNLVIEDDNVPSSVRDEKKLTGFAQSDPYAITSVFWRVYDGLITKTSSTARQQRVFNRLSSALDTACCEARTMKTLKRKAFTAFYNIQKDLRT